MLFWWTCGLPSSLEDRNDFVLKDLKVNLADIFMVPTSQLLRLEFFMELLYLSASEALRAGVPWTATGGQLVHGWSIKESILQVRVSGCMPGFPRDPGGQFTSFNRVLHFSRGGDKTFSGAGDGAQH
jgi:hypothetical protein